MDTSFSPFEKWELTPPAPRARSSARATASFCRKAGVSVRGRANDPGPGEERLPRIAESIRYPHLEEAYWFGEGVLPRLAAQGLWIHPFRGVAAVLSVAQIPFVEPESARVARIP